MNARDRNAVIASSTSDVAERVSSRHWPHVSHELDARGCAPIEHLLVPAECAALAALYSNEDIFRSRIVMERHGFGRGECQSRALGASLHARDHFP